MANILLERQQGNLPRLTELNPKGHCNAITLRNGKGLEAPLKSENPENEDKKVNSNKQVEYPQKAQPMVPKNPMPMKVPFP